MQCPACNFTDSRVLESRSTEGGKSIRRRRECLQCKNRFTTYERVELVPITVLKRDGQREPFDRAKVLRGVIRACEKTGVTSARIEAVVSAVESEIQQSAQREIESRRIGELVLCHLRQENEVAYVRFASVYRQFQGIKDFTETLNTLLPNPGVVETLQTADIV
ncbi:MAG: transcriptional regulator NrdR [Spirulina sp. SIO3F2]|nr:transcriptional regulator NrdR [Spirulina sp. SIO3F2]